MLPEELYSRLQQEYALTPYDAKQLCEEKPEADLFLETAKLTPHYKAIANWILGPVKQYVNEHHLAFASLTLSPQILADLVALVDEGKVNFSTASHKILPVLFTDESVTPLEVATRLNLLQTNDDNEIRNWVQQVLTTMPDKVSEYKKGKKGLIGLFVGEVKKLSKGKADPKTVTHLIEEQLN